MRKAARSILVLLMIGTFVSARQISSRPDPEHQEQDAANGRSGSVFFAHEGCVDLSRLAEASGPTPVPAMQASFSDTLEMYDIELKPENSGGMNAKTIAALVIAAAFVAYALYLFLDPGGDDVEPDNGGKDVPGPYLRAPVSR